MFWNLFHQVRSAKQIRSFQPSLEALEERVVMTATSVTIISFPEPALLGASVQLTAQVSPVPPGTGTPMGLVTFTEGTLTLGSSSLSLAGTLDQAGISTTHLPLGTDTITASYAGSGTFAAASATATETVESWSLNESSALCSGDSSVALGETTINLQTGAAQIDQYLDFSRSDAGRSGPIFGLVYDSAAAVPIIQVEGTLSPTPSTAPLNIGVMTYLDGSLISIAFVANPTYEVNVPLGSASAGLLGDTGLHTWGGTLSITLSSGGDTETIGALGSAYVVDERNSPYGAGWGLEGVNQLESLSNGELWLDGTGDASFFSGTPSVGATFSSPSNDFGTLSEGSGGFTYAAQDGSMILFNTAGYETALVPAAGPSWGFGYNASHDLTLVSASDGSNTTLNYSAGLLTSIIEPGGTVTVGHDGGGNVTDIVQSNGTTRTLGYSAGSHLLTLDDWSPYATTLSYDPNSGAVTSIALSSAENYGLTVAALGAGTATLTDGDGNATLLALSSGGSLTQEVQPGSLMQSWGYNTAGEQTLSVDADGHATSDLWSNGNLTKVIDPDGGTFSFGYDPTFNQMTLEIDADGNTTEWGLDTLGETISETDGVGSGTASTWDWSYSAGLMISEIDADGNTLSLGYNASSQLTHEELFDSLGSTISNESFTNNAEGYVSLTTMGVGGGSPVTVTTNIDALGQLLSEVDGVGNTMSNTWLASGLLSSSTDGRGIETSYGINAAGFVTFQINDVNLVSPEVTAMSFDFAGNETTMKEAGGLTLVDSYNSDDWLTKQLGFDSGGTQIGSTSFAYDNAGNVTLTVDGAGNETKDFQDSMNQLTSEAVYDSGNTLIDQFSQSWDKNGNLTTFTDGAGNETIDVFDAQGWLTTETVKDSALNVISKETMSLDGDGNVTATTDGVGNVTTERYDGDELVEEKMADSLGSIFSDYSYSYNLDGFLTLTTDDLGNTTSDTFDGNGNVLSEVVKDSLGTVVGSESYSYDGNANVIETIDGVGNTILTGFNPDNLATLATTLDGLGSTIGVQSFGFDTLQEQIQSTMGGAVVVSDSFDGGELTKEVTLGGVTQVGWTSYAFDQAGETTLTVEGGSITVSDYFDGGNLTKEVTLDSGGGTIDWSSMAYDLAGEQTLSIQGGSITTSDSFDGGQLTKEVVTDSGGNTIEWSSYGYDQAGEQTLSIQSGSVTTSDSYDGGQVTKEVVTGSGGGTINWTSYGYDEESDPTLTIEGGSITISDSYDGGNLTKEVVLDSGASTISWTSFGYDLAGETTLTVQGGSLTLSDSYDGGNLTKEVTLAPGAATIAWTSYAFDQAGEQTLTVEGGSNTVSDSYQGGLLTKEIVLDSGGSTINWTSLGYDLDGDETLTIDGGSITTSDSFDSGELTKQVVLDSLGNTMNWQSFGFDQAGDQTLSINGGSVTTSDSYQGGLLTKEIVLDSGGSTVSSTSMAYDSAGEATLTVEGGSITISDSYSGGLLTKEVILDSVGTTLGSSSFGYDTLGETTLAISGGVTTQSSYDGGNLTFQAQVSAGTTLSFESWGYNTAGEQTLTVDDLGNSTSLGYKGDLVTLEVVTSAGTTIHASSYGYNSAGEMTMSIDGDNNTRSFYFDGGELVSENWYNSLGSLQQSLSFGYNQAGELIKAINAAGTYTFGYDGGYLTQQIDPNSLTIDLSYDKEGSVTLMTDSQGGTISQSWDGGNLVAQSFQNGATVGLLSLAYNQAGEMTGMTRFADLAATTLVGSTSLGYDAGMVDSILHTDGSGNTLASFGYGYDTTGQMTLEVNNGSSTNFGYNGDGELTSAGTQGYSWDANGNQSGAGTSVGADNELLSDGTWNYQYDDAGNMIGRTQVSGTLSWSYGYDAANEMTLAVETNGTSTLVSTSFGYDAFGNRIAETAVVGATTTTTDSTFLAVNPPVVGADATNWRLFADLNSGGTVQTRYLAGTQPDQWFARVDSTGVHWLLTDNLGSVRVVTNSSGSMIDTNSYDAFGNMTQSAPTLAGRVGYAGYLWDSASGSWHSGPRDLFGQRWAEPDPSGLAPDSNPYRDVGNDPLDATDASGLCKTTLPMGFLLKASLASFQKTAQAQPMPLKTALMEYGKTFTKSPKTLAEALANAKANLVAFGNVAKAIPEAVVKGAKDSAEWLYLKEQRAINYLIADPKDFEVTVATVGGKAPVFTGKQNPGVPPTSTDVNCIYPKKLTVPGLGSIPATTWGFKIEASRDGMEVAENNDWAWTRIILTITLSLGTALPEVTVRNDNLFIGAWMQDDINAVKDPKKLPIMVFEDGKWQAGYADTSNGKIVSSFPKQNLPVNRQRT